MKQLLITGFDPFGGGSVNPSWEAVSRLPERVADWCITKLQIPTVFGAAADRVLAHAQGADVILCVGQAGGRKAVTPERIAINCRNARIEDNAGFQPAEQPCVPGGPDGIFSTVPVSRMAEAITAAGFPAAVSNSAGTFVCNDTLYRLLHHFSGTPVRVGFIHVPWLPEQAENGGACMPLADIVAALESAIAAIG